MKNQTLIEKLQTFDSEMEVFAGGYEIDDVVEWEGDIQIETT
jgi:hypothetical protein